MSGKATGMTKKFALAMIAVIGGVVILSLALYHCNELPPWVTPLFVAEALSGVGTLALAFAALYTIESEGETREEENRLRMLEHSANLHVLMIPTPHRHALTTSAIIPNEFVDHPLVVKNVGPGMAKNVRFKVTLRRSLTSYQPLPEDSTSMPFLGKGEEWTLYNLDCKLGANGFVRQDPNDIYLRNDHRGDIDALVVEVMWTDLYDNTYESRKGGLSLAPDANNNTMRTTYANRSIWNEMEPKEVKNFLRKRDLQVAAEAVH